MPNPFTRHPETVNETYGEHLAVAGGFGLKMIAGGCACLVHAIFPFLFERTGADTVRALHDRMSGRRARADEVAPGARRAA